VSAFEAVATETPAEAATSVMVARLIVTNENIFA
jgi:hypothetical protein